MRGKISCNYKTHMIQEATSKRRGQNFKMVATTELQPEFQEAMQTGSMICTEKLDGTCCLISKSQMRDWLWARHDIKPNKDAASRYKTFQQEQATQREQTTDLQVGTKEHNQEQCFHWDLEQDYKEKPDMWEFADNRCKPQSNGHLVGFVPVDPSLRQHLWHLSAVNLNLGLAVMLKYTPTNIVEYAAEERIDDKINVTELPQFALCIDRLSEYEGQTAELIGTHVNGNPYGLGNKQNPFHVYVIHGSVPINYPPGQLTDHDQVKQWFQDPDRGSVEGMVWHTTDRGTAQCEDEKECDSGVGNQRDGEMFKLHRCHMDIKWPDPSSYGVPRLSRQLVRIDTSVCAGHEHELKGQMKRMHEEWHGRTCPLNQVFLIDTISTK